MSLAESLVVILAGIAAGTINTIVGSGTLITFPTLVLLGLNPLSANISNTVGLVAGGLSGIHGNRRELTGAGTDLAKLVPMSLLGAVTGAALLLVVDPKAFAIIVPALIALGVLLVLLGPRLSATVQARRAAGAAGERPALLPMAVFATAIYGGYFGAAQGVLLMGVLGVLSAHPLRRQVGYKNVLATVTNAVAAGFFVLVARDQINWAATGLIAIGALIGGQLGSTIGRRLAPGALRGVIALTGTVAIMKLLWW